MHIESNKENYWGRYDKNNFQTGWQKCKWRGEWDVHIKKFAKNTKKKSISSIYSVKDDEKNAPRILCSLVMFFQKKENWKCNQKSNLLPLCAIWSLTDKQDMHKTSQTRNLITTDILQYTRSNKDEFILCLGKLFVFACTFTHCSSYSSSTGFPSLLCYKWHGISAYLEVALNMAINTHKNNATFNV